MEWKDGRLQLPNVTLMAMTSVNVRQTIKAMQYSMRQIDFGDCVLITHRKPFFLPKGIRYAHTSKLTNIDCFNYKMLYELGDYIHTDFVMVVHADGFIVHPEMWQDEFLDYDYIGSPWPIPKDDITYRDINGNLCRVGNSVGIRSRRLVNFPKEANLPFEPDHGSLNEDGVSPPTSHDRFGPCLPKPLGPISVMVHIETPNPGSEPGRDRFKICLIEPAFCVRYADYLDV